MEITRVREEATTLYFPMVKNDGTLLTDVTAGNSTRVLSKDGADFETASGAFAQIQTSGLYSLALSDTDLEAGVIVVKVTKNSDTAALPQVIIINTLSVSDQVWKRNLTVFPNTSAPERSAAGRMVADIQRILANKLLIEQTPTQTKLVLKADDGSTTLYEWVLTDIAGAPVIVTGTGPANRGTQIIP